MGTTESSLAAPPPRTRRPQHHASPTTQSPAVSRPRPIRRPRPGPVVTLNGLVLGLTGSGKRTLLQRLEGKDPFASVATDGSNSEHQHLDEDVPRDVTVPFQPPQNATVSDRIQLHVELTPNKDVAVDFSVILVNPRHDAKSLQPYISRLVSMLIQQRNRDTPLCLCFLLNFRDLQGDRYPRIQRDTVEKWAGETIEKHNVHEDLVILQCTTTSLKNCYGLSSLHHLIYRCYLVHKEIELKQRLAEVQHSLKESQEVPSMTYEAFLKAVAQTSKASFGEQHGPSTEEGQKRDFRTNSNEKEYQQTLERTKQQSDADSRHKETQNEPDSLRSILPKTYGDPKKSLEAFFADDDEEEGIVTPVTSHHARDRILHSSDSDEGDDEDDDFFYDEGGHRHQHGTVIMDSLSDQEDEEQSVESLDSQIAHARDHSILDSEDSSVNESGELDVVADVSAPFVNEADTSADVASSNNNEEVVQGGWDDHDDIDLDEDGDDAGEALYNKDEGNGGPLQTPRQAVASGSDEADANDDDGWGDDNDIDLDIDAEPDTPAPSSQEEDVSADGTNATSRETKEVPVEKEQVAAGRQSTTPAEPSSDEKVPTKQQDSPSSDQATPYIATDDTVPKVDKLTEPSPSAPVAKMAPSQTEQDDSSDDDDFIVEDTEHASSSITKDEAHVNETPVVSADAKIPASSRHPDESNDETAASSTSPIPTPTQPASPKVTETDPVSEIQSSQPSSSSSSTGISAAALAAVAAAEKEAARMMQDASKEAPPPDVSNKVERKKSKKKKDPDAKKKKKKHSKESSSAGKRSTKESS